MPDVKRIKLQDGIEGLVRPMPLITLPKKLHEELEGWLRDTIPQRIKDRDADKPRRLKWLQTLRGKRSDPAISRDASNLSVPLSIWVSSNTRARQIEGIFNIPPFVTARPLGGEREGEPQAALKVATDLQKFLEAEIRNPMALDGYNAGEKIITEKTNYGTSALKVYIEPDKAMLAPGGEAVDIIRGRPKWAYVSFEDLIYWDGYGTDTQIMPYIGHAFTRTWSDMLTWVELGYYEKKAIDDVKSFYADDEGKESRGAAAPVTVIEHNIAELYLNFSVTTRTNDDGTETVGLPAALIVDYHLKAEKILRVTWNTNRRGVRPIFIDQFDVNPDPRDLKGQGVCEKLEGAQDETDAVHNIGIEAGKLAAAHLIGVKMGSQAEKDLGGGDPVLPGDLYASEDPDEDVTTKQLGDPQAAVVAVQLEEHTRQYVMRMFGFDEGSLGDMSSGKRVPASLGLSIQREGKIPTSHSLSKSSDMYTDATYLTIDLYREVMPVGSLIAAVGAESAAALQEVVFGVADVESRDQFIINVTAQDASTINEQRKNELMMMTQFLFGFYDKLIETAGLAAQVPPEFKDILIDIIEKLQNSVRLLLSNIESIQNPEEVIPEVAEAMRELGAISNSVAGAGGPSALQEGVG